MNRKLLILNAVLVGVLVYAGVQFRGAWRASKTREAAKLGVKVRPAPVPQFPATALPPPVMATNYVGIPDKFLLDRSRNAVVPVEPPPPPPPPPPPKPMPPLPVYHGLMNLGDGTGLFAILSVTSTAPHEAIHRGEIIGQFKLLDVNRDGIDFDWDGKTVHRTLDEVTDHSAQQQAAAAPQQAAVAAPPREQPPQRPLGPGAETGRDNLRICQANDSNPGGVVVDGYRKIVKPGPFGPWCYWEPVAAGAGR